jgi:hypothetical protein
MGFFDRVRNVFGGKEEEKEKEVVAEVVVANQKASKADMLTLRKTMVHPEKEFAGQERPAQVPISVRKLSVLEQERQAKMRDLGWGK